MSLALAAAGAVAGAGWQTHWPREVFGLGQVSAAAPFPAHRAHRHASSRPSGGPVPSASPAVASATAPAAQSATPQPTPAAAPDAGGPAATVEAYFVAIDNRDFAVAWRLGGRNVGGSYSNFVSGFSATARDTVTVLSVSGNVVTARLTAEQTDGTVKVFQGAYTVQGGVIVQFNVQQIS